MQAGRQLKMHRDIGTVPADVTNTVSILPWLPCQVDTIKVISKRKLQYEQSSVLSLNMRPYQVVQAANWLMSNSSLYRDEWIVVNPDWAQWRYLTT